MPPKPHFLAPAYTPLQQDRQARNRPSHTLSNPSTTSPADAQATELWRDETFESRERRRQAAMYLESNEMLIWYAASRNESVPQTRLHFEKILAGFASAEDSDDVAWADDWDNDSDECERRWEEKQERARAGNAPLAAPASPLASRTAEQQCSGAGAVGGSGGSSRGGTPRKVSSPRSKGGRGKVEQKRKDGKRRSGGGGGGSGQGGSAAA